MHVPSSQQAEKVSSEQIPSFNSFYGLTTQKFLSRHTPVLLEETLDSYNNNNYYYLIL